MSEKQNILAWFDPEEQAVMTRYLKDSELEDGVECSSPFYSILNEYDCAQLDLPDGGNSDFLTVINFLQYVLNRDMNIRRDTRIPLPTDWHLHDENSKVAWTMNWSKAMSQEIAELIDSCPWKWWKDMDFDKQNARVEAVDLLHFLVSLFQTLGMTPKDVTDAYIKKNMVNHQRQNQEGGYTAENKNPDDSRHI